MHPGEAVHLQGWRAELDLAFERRAARTVLAARRHAGPLVVQKPFYPEGEAVCHAIVLHPPAGIAGGDDLELSARSAGGAHALLTTPGAGKWYRSAGSWARQRLDFDVAEGACLEWLPQETIIYDGALARLETEVRLAGDACYLGWEILCLGRTGSGEAFQRGTCRLRTTVLRDGKAQWLERGIIDGGGELLDARVGLGGQPVCGTLIVAAPVLAAELIAACRVPQPSVGAGAVTCLPGTLVARYLGPSSEAARRYFARLWGIIRPEVLGRTATVPRIWAT
ncbi:MAG: urease accessory protein UreD [Betaproteobacteria bacterium]|jgi:urease accessory protein|nr:urease accessory protein UreD [Betaproteobacteria bacterium]